MKAFKIGDSVKIIGNIQGWKGLIGTIKEYHGVDYIVSCGPNENDEILVMEREITICGPSSFVW